jgi:RHH-type proline utilization regulon transcriptional repressor/proline dehydrogenase/delta 1-pyrroline-5-carboxylate dehydrogenase
VTPLTGTTFDLGAEPPHEALAPLRERIAACYRADESEALSALIDEARLAPQALARVQVVATTLAEAVRAARSNAGGVDALMLEFSLDSREGIALMCLAEALLRIPDAATRDRLIRDKISRGDWSAHVGASPSLFVNAAAWGLLVTGKIVETRSEGTLEQALSSLLRKGGEPLIRKGVDLAMRLLGRQFVTGRTIDEALANARDREARGYTFSYDMLGEAAMTAADAQRYFVAYDAAIHAIGRAANGRGVVAGPGISMKLSALHPRFCRAQRERVIAELTPKLVTLARLAKGYDIGLAIDAEEADRLDLSLDLLARLAADPALADWHGLGFVVQCYQKRARPTVDWIVALARQHKRRLMLRLVKGAYWDAEIKRAEVDGLPGYPVFTRKVHTDVAYLACAKAMLAAPDAIYSQFASHNAFTIAAVHELAGDAQYEFQCLHGMGESIYDEVVGKAKLDRACRIYAPVGSHETLLAYLVRRLLENGANSSFVNRIVDPAVAIASLVVDPVAIAEAGGGRPHAGIPLPVALLPGRRNSRGADLADDVELAKLTAAFEQWGRNWSRVQLRNGATSPVARAPAVVEPDLISIRNPADRDDVIGTVVEATVADVATAVAIAVERGSEWSVTPAAERAAYLERAADLLEAERVTFLALAVREAGKTLANAVAEVREAIDFLRYYAAQARAELAAPGVMSIGPVVAISPWNFPLAIFVGEVAAALAAGNPVLAKPAEQTPLIAREAVRLLHRAGVPGAALQLLPGRGETVGAALVADPRVAGVIFTGSTEVARLIHGQLATRDDDPVLIAETGGQNAMIVDSSALPEQVVADALSSAFDSAGQRCSALRILCLQDDVAPEMLSMLEGAMRELVTGDPRRLATDVGPVIDAEARSALVAHVERMRAAGLRIVEMPLPPECARGTFVAPTLVDLGDIPGLAHLTREVFGPILHVVRWKRDELPALIDAINATGYGLTHGIHTRIDETVAAITSRIRAGNIYVNRNIVGAVVGVQPFGGHGLSGTGPKAGGPLYLRRLTRGAPVPAPEAPITLPGPTGEANTLEFHPRGVVACIADDERGLFAQAKAALAFGNTVLLLRDPVSIRIGKGIGGARITFADALDPAAIDAVLLDVDRNDARRVRGVFAAAPGKIVPIVVPDAHGKYDWARLVVERTVTVNTAAAGGNAALLSLSEDAP